MQEPGHLLRTSRPARNNIYAYNSGNRGRLSGVHMSEFMGENPDHSTRDSILSLNIRPRRRQLNEAMTDESDPFSAAPIDANILAYAWYARGWCNGRDGAGR